MIAPDAEIDGKGVVLVDSETAGEPSEADNKPLKEFGLADGSVLACDDFVQNYNIKVYLYQTEDLADGVEFEIVGDISKLKEQQKEPETTDKVTKEQNESNGEGVKDQGDKKNGSTSNGSNGNHHSQEKEKEQVAKKNDDVIIDDDVVAVVEDDDDVIAVEEDDPVMTKKRAASATDSGSTVDDTPKTKKMRLNESQKEDEEDGVVCID